MDIETNELTQFSDELMRRLGSGGGLDGIMSSEFFEDQDTMYMDQDEHSEDNEPDDVIILHMDIREPLRSLQTLVEKKVGMKLSGYKFCLQDTQELEPHKNLVDQCVKGEGLVQINVQIRTIQQRINIVDVLKPTEEALAAIAAEDAINSVEKLSNDDTNIAEEVVISQPVANDIMEGVKPCQNWVLDHKFKKEQTRLRIPEDPVEWSLSHVQHWFNWAVNEFELSDFIDEDWAIDGVQLCSMTHQEFRKRMPRDPGNVFWTHLQLLKECKYVTVMHKSGQISPLKTEETEDKIAQKRDQNDLLKEPKIMRKSNSASRSTPYILSEQTSRIFVQTATCTFSPGNSGNMHLWQFLLDILTDREHTDIIQWVGSDGEFKLRNPEEVARLWGVRKNKPAMNYEKLSRALRYYYDGDMISKVSGKRFAYKFDCDLELLTGYSAEELSRLVNEKPMNEGLYSDDVKDETLDYLLNDGND